MRTAGAGEGRTPLVVLNPCSHSSTGLSGVTCARVVGVNAVGCLIQVDFFPFPQEIKQVQEQSAQSLRDHIYRSCP